MPKHHCTVVPTTVRTARKRKKDPVKYPEVANVTFHCFPQNNEKIQYVPGMSELVEQPGPEN